jgi:hypothetical protein
MKHLLFLLIFSFSVNAEETVFPSIDIILEGMQYQSIGQSRYSLGIKNISGETIYPKCRKVFNRIYRLYAGPHIVQKFWEESVFTHRRVWQKKAESLSLRCFEKNGNRYAEWVSLYKT